MDRYHILNEIGVGRQSQVFKGRAKKTTTYVAIKRVEKSLLDKVVNEVAIMHALQHPHALKFYDWYETRNNLWLILEYCSGGDLKSLLKTDKQLPMAAVKLLAGDLLAGLQYLHYSGILYCDLKPSNVLIDEHGVLKLAGFGLSRRIPTASNRQRAPKNRGTPYYMSPELFLRDGVHSFGSDLWSLGCVCYELATGHPPFLSQSLNDLMDRIGKVEPDYSEDLFRAHADDDEAPRKGPFQTCDFVRALKNLLQKDPRSRPTWADLRDPRASFWHDVLPAPPADKDLPPQPLFEAALLHAAQQSLPETPDRRTQAGVATTPPRDVDVENCPPTVEVHQQRRIITKKMLRVSRHYQDHRRSSEQRQSLKEIPEEDKYDDDDHTREEETASAAEAESSMSKVPEAVIRLVFANVDRQVRPILEDSWSSTWSPRATGGPEKTFTEEPPSSKNQLLPGFEFQEKSDDAPRHMMTHLPFATKSVDELNGLSPEVLEAHLVLSYEALVNATATTQLLSTIAYLQTACACTQVSNVMVNSSFVTVFLQILETCELKDVRLELLGLICLLMRHATYIVPGDDLDTDADAAVPLINALRTLLRDEKTDARERQLTFAALGELLFFLTTQEDDEHRGENHIANELMACVVSYLDNDEGGLVYYATKTVGNIFARAKAAFARSLASTFVASKLALAAAAAFADNGTSEPGRAASFALVQLLRTVVAFDDANGGDDDTKEKEPSSPKASRRALVSALENLGGLQVVVDSSLIAMKKADDTLWQLINLNLLNATLALVATKTSTVSKDDDDDEACCLRYRSQLTEDRGLAAALARTLAGTGGVASSVRAKAALSLLLLGIAHLPSLCLTEPLTSSRAGGQADLVAALEKLASKDDLSNDPYFSASVLALLAFLSDAAKLIAHLLARLLVNHNNNNQNMDDVAQRPLRSALTTATTKNDNAMSTDDFSSPAGPSLANPFPHALAAVLATMKTPGVQEGSTWGHLSVGDLAASLPLVSRAAASPLLKPQVLTATFVNDVGIIVSSVARRPWQLLAPALPELLEALVSRDAEVLAPYAGIVLKDDGYGLLPAACGLVAASTDKDLRLTALHLLRHTLPALLSGLTTGNQHHHHRQQVLGDIDELLGNHLPNACVSILPSHRSRNYKDDAAQLMEAECSLRLLLETLPRWPRAAALFASHQPLVRAIQGLNNGRETNLAALANQLTKNILASK